MRRTDKIIMWYVIRQLLLWAVVSVGLYQLSGLPEATGQLCAYLLGLLHMGGMIAGGKWLDHDMKTWHRQLLDEIAKHEKIAALRPETRK